MNNPPKTHWLGLAKIWSFLLFFQVRNPYHCLLLNLAVIELLLAIINIPIDIYSITLGYFPFSRLACDVTGFLATTNGAYVFDYYFNIRQTLSECIKIG